MLADVAKRHAATAASGDTIVIVVTNVGGWLGAAHVVKTDIAATHGVFRVVGTVMLPGTSRQDSR